MFQQATRLARAVVDVDIDRWVVADRIDAALLRGDGDDVFLKRRGEHTAQLLSEVVVAEAEVARVVPEVEGIGVRVDLEELRGRNRGLEEIRLAPIFSTSPVEKAFLEYRSSEFQRQNSAVYLPVVCAAVIR